MLRIEKQIFLLEKKTNSEIVYLNVASKVINYLESFLNVPPNKLLDFRQKSSEILFDEITNEKIEKIATLSRKFLEIQSDNGNLLLSLEKSGIYVLEKMLVGRQMLIVHGQQKMSQSLY